MANIPFDILTHESIEFDVSSKPAVEFVIEATGDDAYIYGTDEYIRISSSELPTFAGPYYIVPAVVAQTLPTARTSMRNDVTVDAIPYSQTSNEAGGYTISIAS